MSTQLFQKYSQTGWVADGTQDTWNFTFSGNDTSLKYLARAHVKTFYILADDLSNTRHEITLVDPTDWIGDYTVRTVPAPPAGSTFVIYRDTPKDKPLVDWADGANISEPTLDLIAKQCVFIAAEALDQAGFSDELGFKAMKQVPYTGASTLHAIDNGRSHYKTDGTDVAVPNTLPVEYLTTIINNSSTRLTVNVDGLAYLQGTELAGVATFDIGKHNTATLTKVANGVWFVNGFVLTV